MRHAAGLSIQVLLLVAAHPLGEAASPPPTGCFLIPRRASVETPSEVLALLAGGKDLGLLWWLALAKYRFLFLWEWKAVLEVWRDVKVRWSGGGCSHIRFVLIHLLQVLLHVLVVEVVRISRSWSTFAL